MNITKGQLLFLIIIYVHNSLCVVWIPYSAAKEVWKLYSMMDKIKMNTTEDIRRVNELFKDGPNVEIRYQIDKVHEQLEEIEKSIYSKILKNSIKQLNSDVMLDRGSDTFEIFIGGIDENYEAFRQYMKEGNYHSNEGLQDFVQRTSIGIEVNVNMIRTIMTNAEAFLPGRKNLIFAITGLATALQWDLCDGPQIISSVLAQLFVIVIIAEMKATLMIFFGNLLRYTANEEWKSMNTHVIEQFEIFFTNYIKEFQMNMVLADSLYLRACDPPNSTWVRGESFYELEGTFQTTIFRHHWARCKHDSCNAVWFRKASQCDPTIYDLRSSCSDTIAECTYLNAVRACVLKSGPYKFQYVNSSALGLLGRNSTCPRNGYIIEDGTGWDFIHATCACNCYSDRNKISLQIMESRVKLNRVIIGLRFVRKNQILYIQPLEAALTTNGKFRRFSNRWMDIPSKTGKDSTHPINKENSVFFLDDLRLPPKFLLTGIKFSRVTRHNITGFAIEIFGVPFNYETGKLTHENASRISIQTTHKNSMRELPFEAISSAHTRLPYTVSSSDMGYVSLRRSKLHDDFGQSTLPFFDAVPVKTHFPSLLGGVGIFHKGVPGYAGIISLRVYGIKYGIYFDDFRSFGMKNNKVSLKQCSL